jgi:hypothetical protein
VLVAHQDDLQVTFLGVFGHHNKYGETEKLEFIPSSQLKNEMAEDLSKKNQKYLQSLKLGAKCICIIFYILMLKKQELFCC